MEAGKSGNNMNKNDYLLLEDTYGAHNYHPLNVVLEKGKGIWVWDTDGKKYLDFLSGYSALNHGHCHPVIARAVREQIQRITLTGRAFRNDQFGLFCKELCTLTGYEMFLPMNTGAEAVETALKVARKYAYSTKNIPENQAEIIVFSNNFHGRTITIVSFSSDPQYKKGFGAFTPGFSIVEYGNIPALKKAITPKTAAILIEPIQGEGGIIVPPPGFLSEVMNICRKEDILLIADEIQTGLGRTGKLFAYEYEKQVRPDILTVGKALGGGFYPVSGILTSEKILSVIKPGDHGSTFGGNPLAAAIGRISLKVLIDEGMIENSFVMGEYLKKKLMQIQSRWIKQIRGKGLFIGIELTEQSGGARKFCEILATRGILCKETHDMVLRFSPPLIITKAQIDWAVKIVKTVLETQ